MTPTRICILSITRPMATPSGAHRRTSANPSKIVLSSLTTVPSRSSTRQATAVSQELGQSTHNVAVLDCAPTCFRADGLGQLLLHYFDSRSVDCIKCCSMLQLPGGSKHSLHLRDLPMLRSRLLLARPAKFMLWRCPLHQRSSQWNFSLLHVQPGRFWQQSWNLV